jgi:hypothetical protein
MIDFYCISLRNKKNKGDIGTAILIIGVGLSLITSLISEKGRWKTISISIVSIVIGVYLYMIIASFFVFCCNIENNTIPMLKG